MMHLGNGDIQNRAWLAGTASDRQTGDVRKYWTPAFCYEVRDGGRPVSGFPTNTSNLAF